MIQSDSNSPAVEAAPAARRAPATRKAPVVRRKEILDAAAELLVEIGPGILTVDQVAEKVGIGKTTVYLYYPSRENLLEAATRQVLGDCVAEAVAGTDGLAPDQAIEAYCRQLFKAASRLPVEVFSLGWVETAEGREAMEGFLAEQFVARAIDTASRIIEQAGCAPEAARSTGRALIAAVLMEAQWAGRGRGAATDGPDVVRDALHAVGLAGAGSDGAIEAGR